ncbi:hypothetical protein BDV06DRAFT_217908 [Aspergillus oleicola]
MIWTRRKSNTGIYMKRALLTHETCREKELRQLQKVKDKEIAEKKEADKVRKVYESLESTTKRQKLGPDSLVGKKHRLYSTDYIEHCFIPSYYATKYIEFYRLGEDDWEVLAEQEEKQTVNGHMYFSSSYGPDLKPFTPPKYTGLDAHELEAFRGTDSITVQFLNNDYVRFKVPREVGLFDGDTNSSKPIPDAFEFNEIRFGFEKERKEREKALEEAKRKRSPSPRESWFEMNHPMGWWRQNGNYWE